MPLSGLSLLYLEGEILQFSVDSAWSEYRYSSGSRVDTMGWRKRSNADLRSAFDHLGTYSEIVLHADLRAAYRMHSSRPPSIAGAR